MTTPLSADTLEAAMERLKNQIKHGLRGAGYVTQAREDFATLLSTLQSQRKALELIRSMPIPAARDVHHPTEAIAIIARCCVIASKALSSPAPGEGNEAYSTPGKPTATRGTTASRSPSKGVTGEEA